MSPVPGSPLHHEELVTAAPSVILGPPLPAGPVPGEPCAAPVPVPLVSLSAQPGPVLLQPPVSGLAAPIPVPALATPAPVPGPAPLAVPTEVPSAGLTPPAPVPVPAAEAPEQTPAAAGPGDVTAQSAAGGASQAGLAVFRMSAAEVRGLWSLGFWGCMILRGFMLACLFMVNVNTCCPVRKCAEIIT